MNPTNVTIEELIEAFGFGAYSSDKGKIVSLRLALNNAYQQGKLDAIAEYEGLDYRRDAELHITRAGHEALAETKTQTIIDNGIQVEIETPKPVYKTMGELADEAGF